MKTSKLLGCALFVLVCLPACGGGGGGKDPNVSVDSKARSCELTIVDPDRAVTGIQFGDKVEGRVVREGTRFAVSFVSKEDAAIAGDQIALERVEGASLANVSIEIVRCFDRAGAAIAGATVSLK